jgi:hypothetical protein
MKKFISGVVVGLIVGGGIGFAAPSFDHNGLFWNKLSVPAKTGYINGYSDAMQVSVGKLDSLTIAADLFHWKGANKIIRQLSHELSMSEMASNDAVRKLDSLYANPKYSELDLGQALQLLSATDLAQQPENANPKSQSPTSQK